MTTATVEPGAEHRDDRDRVLRQLFPNVRGSPSLMMTIQFPTETRQPNLVGQHQASDALALDQFEKLIESFLAVVQTGAESRKS